MRQRYSVLGTDECCCWYLETDDWRLFSFLERRRQSVVRGKRAAKVDGGGGGGARPIGEASHGRQTADPDIRVSRCQR
jgi:hypothetical protein